MSRTITLVGARGGQGASTVAAALAASLSADTPTALLSHEPLAVAQLLGAMPPLPGEAVEVAPEFMLAGLDGPRAETTVIDAGRATTAPEMEGERYAVVRGPCYLALATLVSLSLRLDGVVLVAEPGRAMGAEDVTAVLEVPVLATIPVHPAVARTVDAGLLAVKARCLAAFRPLDALAGNSREREVRVHHLPEPAMRIRPATLAIGQAAPNRADGLVWEMEP